MPHHSLQCMGPWNAFLVILWMSLIPTSNRYIYFYSSKNRITKPCILLIKQTQKTRKVGEQRQTRSGPQDVRKNTVLSSLGGFVCLFVCLFYTSQTWSCRSLLPGNAKDIDKRSFNKSLLPLTKGPRKRQNSKTENF